MFSESVCMTAAALGFSKWVLCRHFSRLSACGERSGLQVRQFSVSRSIARKATSQREPKERVHVPGLDTVTYGEKRHYVPWLAKPVCSHWERDYKDPTHYKSPPNHEMPLYKEKACYVFNQRTNALEGVRQALWLTKSKAFSGLPPELLSTAENPANQLPNQDSRVQNAIKHARFWDTTEERPDGVKYSNTLLFNLLHLCATLQSSHLLTRRRMFVEKCSLAASWKRGDNLFQIRGHNALVCNSMDPLPRVSGLQQVLATVDHTLENFCPVSPTVDLQKVHVYKEEMNCTGFGGKYVYPHAHTLYFLEGDDVRCKLQPEQFRAKMIMFLFGTALAHARKMFGTKTKHVLDNPVTIQAVGTNGRIFQYVVFQLNTTDLRPDDGIKNQVWLDEDAELYDFAKVRPLIVKKQVKVPAGLAGYKPATFSKFLALYLHGAM